MLQVTEGAANLLREIQLAQEDREKVLRLTDRGDGFELVFDAVQADDHVFRSQGSDVLLVSPDIAEILADAIIDAQETPEGPRLTLSSQSP